MFLKKFDMISPPITLYFKGENMHSSKFSGILTILSYLIIIFFAITYGLAYINREKPTAYFLNKYTEDAGEFFFNSSSLFHYVYLANKRSREIIKFDFDIFRIIGLEKISYDPFFTPSSLNLEYIPHWEYGYCNNNTDTEGIGYLITSKDFEKSACIKKYYNPQTKEYYDINNDNFRWPSIAHGMSNPNFTFYGLIIQKCKEDNLRRLAGFGSCKSDESISEFINSNFITLELIDHYPNVLNYNNPFIKYFYSINDMIYLNTFIANNLNFNPALLKTHNGILFDNIIEESSFLYTDTEKITMNEEFELKDAEGNIIYDESGNAILKSSGLVVSYYFYMQNRLQYYERNYEKLQDVLSSIGGLSKTILLISSIINLLVSNYIILLDTEELILSLDNNNSINEKVNSEPKIYNKNIKEIINPPRRKYYDNNNLNPLQHTSNEQRLTNKGNDTNFNIPESNKIQISNNFLKNRKVNLKNNLFSNKYKNLKQFRKFGSDKNQKKISNLKGNFEQTGKSIDIYNYNSNNNIIKNSKEQKDEPLNKPIKKQNFYCIQYIWYMICCGRNNKNISYYEKYREKIISEENIILDHLNIYKIIDLCKLDKNDYIYNEINTNINKI